MGWKELTNEIKRPGVVEHSESPLEQGSDVEPCLSCLVQTVPEPREDPGVAGRPVAAVLADSQGLADVGEIEIGLNPLPTRVSAIETIETMKGARRPD